MGDPKKQKKKYSTPMHPWNEVNIIAERIIKKDYGLRIKKEIFIANSFLKKYKNIAKKLIAVKTPQGEKEKEQILTKLQKLGLLPVGSNLDHILGLELKDILERRLQSILFRKGLARSMKQARQFIVHRHVSLANKEISIPSYLVSLEEESQLVFKENSALASEDHPERVNEAKQIHAEAAVIKTEKTEEEKLAEVGKVKSAEEVKTESPQKTAEVKE